MQRKCNDLIDRIKILDFFLLLQQELNKRLHDNGGFVLTEKYMSTEIKHIFFARWTRVLSNAISRRCSKQELEFPSTSRQNAASGNLWNSVFTFGAILFLWTDRSLSLEDSRLTSRGGTKLMLIPRN